MMELEVLRKESRYLDNKISEVCEKYKISITDFYRDTNKMPFNLLEEAMPYIEQQHAILSKIFKLNHLNPENVVHLADYR